MLIESLLSSGCIKQRDGSEMELRTSVITCMGEHGESRP